MPAVDPGRSRLRLLPDDIEVLLGVMIGDPDCLDHPRAVVLEACGLLRDGRPAPTVAEVLAVLAGPTQIIEVETVHAVAGEDPPQRLLAHRLAVAGAVAVVVDAGVDTDEVELTVVDTVAAGAELARLVGLRERPVAAGPPLVVAAEVLDGLAGVLAGLRDPASASDDVRTVLVVAGLDEREAARLAEVLTSRRGAWRADRALHVVDAGPAGLWHRTPSGGGGVTLTPRSAGWVRDALTALVPGHSGPAEAPAVGAGS